MPMAMKPMFSIGQMFWIGHWPSEGMWSYQHMPKPMGSAMDSDHSTRRARCTGSATLVAMRCRIAAISGRVK
jgi:hypothetical protein